MNALRYEAIDQNANVFRVLLVEGIDEHGHVTCRMRNALVAETTYYALSYTWGFSAERRCINVNGEHTNVTTNLDDFLKKAHILFGGVWIWIDALCINQNDTLERNHQVQQMASIYANARKVIVWLGIDPALDDLFWQINQGRYAIMRCSMDQFLEITDGLTKLDKIAYWRRIWVVQELILARSIQLVLGEEVLSWKEFWHGLQFLKERAVMLAFPEFAELLDRSNFWAHKAQKDSYNSTVKQTSLPANLFASYASFECSNALDRVYALLGLFDHGGLLVNYDDTPGKLGFRFWLHMRCRDSQLLSLKNFAHHLKLPMSEYRKMLPKRYLGDFVIESCCADCGLKNTTLATRRTEIRIQCPNDPDCISDDALWTFMHLLESNLVHVNWSDRRFRQVMSGFQLREEGTSKYVVEVTITRKASASRIIAGCEFASISLTGTFDLS